MNTIAIVGASSQIAKDLILEFQRNAPSPQLLLYVRDPISAANWLDANALNADCRVCSYDSYGQAPHDAVINFVGVGDPMRAAQMGASIFEVTSQFDDMVLRDLVSNPQRRYLFLSSGAVYGNTFTKPVTEETAACIPINRITAHDYYATAKLHAEVRHRSLPDLGIIDFRVFNYFSRTQSMNARFLITDIVRCICENTIFQTLSENIFRDFLHPKDFYQMITHTLSAPKINCALDCYTREIIDKHSLLEAMQHHFGLRYEIKENPVNAPVNATGSKAMYYSLNRKAAEFGYQPQYSSLDCILTEAAALINQFRK